MDEPTTPTDPRPNATGPFLLRWALCTVLVLGVFIASRFTGGADEEEAGAVRPVLPAESTTEQPDADSSAPSPDGGVNVDEVMDDFDDLVDEAFGPAPEESTPGADREAGGGPSIEWITTSGPGAAGGDWTITHPSDWSTEKPEENVTIFSAPDYPNAFSVVSRPFVGPLSEEVDRDLDELLPTLEAAELLALDEVEFGGRPAMRADLQYINPAGRPASASVIWIRDDRSLYLVGIDTPTDQPEARVAMDEVLDSFTISETA